MSIQDIACLCNYETDDDDNGLLNYQEIIKRINLCSSEDPGMYSFKMDTVTLTLFMYPWLKQYFFLKLEFISGIY